MLFLQDALPLSDTLTVPPAASLDARPCAIDGIVAFAPRRFGDARGAFAELHHADRYAAAGVPNEFVQDNAAWSEGGVLRGLHLQHPYGQGKLISVLRGVIFDVAADVRVGSPTFGRYVGVELDADGVSQLWVPAGFAHGYLVRSPDAVVLYKCTEFYRPECELTIRWDDADLAAAWPARPRLLSDKDRAALSLAEAAQRGLLPHYAPAGAPGRAG